MKREKTFKKIFYLFIIFYQSYFVASTSQASSLPKKSKITWHITHTIPQSSDIRKILIGPPSEVKADNNSYTILEIDYLKDRNRPLIDSTNLGAKIQEIINVSSTTNTFYIPVYPSNKQAILQMQINELTAPVERFIYFVPMHAKAENKKTIAGFRGTTYAAIHALKPLTDIIEKDEYDARAKSILGQNYVEERTSTPFKPPLASFKEIETFIENAEKGIANVQSPNWPTIRRWFGLKTGFWRYKNLLIFGGIGLGLLLLSGKYAKKWLRQKGYF